MSETTTIKEKPILFRAEMVRAILDGRKTQTRRIVKLPKQAHPDYGPAHWEQAKPCDWLEGPHHVAFIDITHPTGPFAVCRCPYGQPGDRLWVREAWATRVDCEPGSEKAKHYTLYAASCRPDAPSDPMNWHDFGGRWRPSIHMPRWASRITLEVTEVRVERLQEITEEDAKAEGFDANCPGFATHPPTKDCEYWSARNSFSTSWNSHNAAPFDWASSPWVWVVSFRRVEQGVRA